MSRLRSIVPSASGLYRALQSLAGISGSVACLMSLSQPGCGSSGTEEAPVERSESLLQDPRPTSSKNVFFLSPLESSAIRGMQDVTFATGLKVEVLIEQLDTTGNTIAKRITKLANCAAKPSERVHEDRRSRTYTAHWHTNRYSIEPGQTYRVAVLANDQELGHSEVFLQSWHTLFRRPLSNGAAAFAAGATVPIRFRIAQRAVDRDGDSVVDWLDNCPTVPNVSTESNTLRKRWWQDSSDSCLDEADSSPSQIDSDNDGVGDACECLDVTCTPLNDCHDVNNCDSTTGACVETHREDGSPCNDQDACTQRDRCLNGECVGSESVSCVALDDCHTPGVCESSTGLCTQPSAEDNTPCNDRNACSRLDQCRSGICQGFDFVTCIALDACHTVGECSPTTGICSDPIEPACVTDEGAVSVVSPPGIDGVTATFSEVSNRGVTGATPVESLPVPLPDGFIPGTPPVNFDLATTATFATAVVCVNSSEADFSELPVHLFHFENDQWRDVTASTEDGVVCSVPLTNLSPFSLGGRCPLPPARSPAKCFSDGLDPCIEIVLDIAVLESRISDLIMAEALNEIDYQDCLIEYGFDDALCQFYLERRFDLRRELERARGRLRALQLELEACRRRK